MYCQHCSAQIPDNSRVCPNCGIAVTPNQQATVFDGTPRRMTVNDLPSEFKPMGAWSYFGHSLLFSIPIVGFILLIVFSVGGARNVNKRNFARSFFCVYAILAIIAVVYLILCIVGVASYNIFANMS